MRKPKYLSPSSVKAWDSNRDEFYLRYLAENRPEKFRQTMPMAAGSAFDAAIKSYLHKKLFGNYGKDDAYEPVKIFETQVEKHNWDWARPVGKHIFDRYCLCGGMADLMLELQKAAGPPRFEFSIEGFVTGKAASVPVLGKPDVFFVNAEGARVILDWKVNGYCSNSSTSPKPGYVKCRDGWLGSEKKATRGAGMPHGSCIPTPYKGIRINQQIMMEQVDVDWANQLSIYSWLLGEEVGSLDLIIGIDQVCGQPGEGGIPWLRFASHRCRIGSEYQFALHQHVQDIWARIESGHIFDTMTLEQSMVHQQDLDSMAKNLTGDDDLSKFMNQMRLASA